MGSSLGRGHCVVFLGMKLLLSQCLSPPRCINGYLRIFREEYQIAGECSAMDQHPIDPGGVELLLAASLYRNQVNSGGYRPVGSKASLFLIQLCSEFDISNPERMK